MTNLVEVLFVVKCDQTKPGQHVRVAGSVEELGNWDPEFGLSLTTAPDMFPLWRGGPVLVPSGFEYKYVICTDAGASEQWEVRPNRSAGANLRASMVFDEEFDSLEVVQRQRAASRTSVQRRDSGIRSFVSAEGDRRRASSALLPSENEGPRPSYTSMSLLPTLDNDTDDEGNGASASSHSVSRDEVDANQRLMREGSIGMFQFDDDDACSEFSEMSLCRPETPTNYLQYDQSLTGKYAYDGNLPIAEGTFARVWRVRRLDDGKLFAAKIISLQTLTPLDYRNLFGEDGANEFRQGEIALHEKLKHPNLVAMVEHYVAEDVVTLVLQYCPGGDLFDYIISKRTSLAGLPERGAAIALQGMASGLQYCHDMGLAHRDIKCENVLLAQCGVSLEDGNRCQICDFGLATSVPEEGLEGEWERVGSPDTVAPEIVRGLCYTMAVDVWSTGVVLYMMLSAKAPFGGNNDNEVLKSVRHGKYTVTAAPWPNISQEAVAVVERMLVVDQRKRATMAEVLAMPWVQEHAGSRLA
mmetsp:Transcript_85657/g.229182  ORF Transcript_85657/g.229182 Transcript_85657/m.229182 type:complete len:526 (+) Transcript_85657:57-1634(+)